MNVSRGAIYNEQINRSKLLLFFLFLIQLIIDNGLFVAGSYGEVYRGDWHGTVR